MGCRNHLLTVRNYPPHLLDYSVLPVRALGFPSLLEGI
uniref:Uncharacterized protein n=1 Tax=Arundo donax TaxID=35708 RepID=A0A0A9AR78_ARUDO